MGAGASTSKNSGDKYIEKSNEFERTLGLFDDIIDHEFIDFNPRNIESCILRGDKIKSDKYGSIFGFIERYYDGDEHDKLHMANIIVASILDDLDNQADNWDILIDCIKRESHLYPLLTPEHVSIINNLLPDDDILKDLMLPHSGSETLFAKTLKANNFKDAFALVEYEENEAQRYNKKMEIFFHAIKAGDDQMIKNGMDFNAIDKDGNNALMIAAMGDDESIFQKILERTDDNNKQNNKGQSALMKACMHGNKEFVKILCQQKGILIDLVDDGELSAISHSIDKPELIEVLLLNGAKPFEQESGYRPNLLRATAYRNCESVKKLLKAGADVTKIDRHGATALQFAVANGDLEIAKVLIDADSDVNKISSSGKSVLMRAAINSDGPMVDLLLSKEASLLVDGHGTILNQLVTEKDYHSLNTMVTSIANHKDEKPKNWKILEDFIEDNLDHISGANKDLLLGKVDKNSDIYDELLSKDEYKSSTQLDRFDRWVPKDRYEHSILSLDDIKDHEEPSTSAEQARPSQLTKSLSR